MSREGVMMTSILALAWRWGVYSFCARPILTTPTRRNDNTDKTIPFYTQPGGASYTTHKHRSSPLLAIVTSRHFLHSSSTTPHKRELEGREIPAPQGTYYFWKAPGEDRVVQFSGTKREKGILYPEAARDSLLLCQERGRVFLRKRCGMWDDDGSCMIIWRSEG